MDVVFATSDIIHKLEWLTLAVLSSSASVAVRASGVGAASGVKCLICGVHSADSTSPVSWFKNALGCVATRGFADKLSDPARSSIAEAWEVATMVRRRRRRLTELDGAVIGIAVELGAARRRVRMPMTAVSMVVG
jgi:hypothetical protein